jgi:hypothetical protein
MNRHYNPDISVEIFDTVIARISHAVSVSNREEGGKFIGKISQNGNQIKIRVETYIDSGPRVNNSVGHLMPDGEYQEAMFRVLEKFDQDIHYLGSWHTHHCNGLAKLSPGDIRGYTETVNSRQYNLDYFFALLITDLYGAELQKRYYLFVRNQEYADIWDSAVHILKGSSPLEQILKSAEETAFAHRRSQANFYGGASEHRPQIEVAADFMQKIRSEDRGWILNNFPSAQTLKAKKDGSIYWRWLISLDYGDLKVRYQYPSDSSSKPAHLEIIYDSEEVISENILLDPSRFKQIDKYLQMAIDKISLKVSTQ